MICSNCGKENESGTPFCTECGKYLGEAQEAQQAQQAQQPQQPQQAPVYTPAPQAPANEEPVSVGKWIGIWAINLIPCVGFIVFWVLMIVWAFGSNTISTSLKNYAKAQLIILAIGIVIFVLVYVVIFALGAAAFNLPVSDFSRF